MQCVQEDLLKPPAGVLGGLWLPPPSSSEWSLKVALNMVQQNRFQPGSLNYCTDKTLCCLSLSSLAQSCYINKNKISVVFETFKHWVYLLRQSPYPDQYSLLHGSSAGKPWRKRSFGGLGSFVFYSPLGAGQELRELPS